MAKQLLLISNSICYGQGYLDHCESNIREVLGTRSRVLFIPYAQFDLDAYTAMTRERLSRMGFDMDSVHVSREPAEAVRHAEAIFVGGGNTFILLERLYRFKLLTVIREVVLNHGVPYCGSSAGANVACVSIKTSNDMAIVLPPSLDALGLVSFNINPHYIPPDSSSRHMGETRDARIREFHTCNDPIVVGLREGAMLRIVDSTISLVGSQGARVFIRGEQPKDYAPNVDIDFAAG